MTQKGIKKPIRKNTLQVLNLIKMLKSSARQMDYCSLTFAQVSLNPTVLLKTNFSAEESLSTQK